MTEKLWLLVDTKPLLQSNNHDIISHVIQIAIKILLCPFSSPYKNISGPCDVFHSDKKTSSQAAYIVGTDGTKGWRTPWRTEPEPEAGEPQVHMQPVKGLPFMVISVVQRHNCGSHPDKVELYILKRDIFCQLD